MANAAGFIKESIWRDKDFRALPRTAQATYGQLLSQKELDRAGMLPLRVGYWAKGCDEITESALWVDLKLLEERRFIFVDEDTDEVFIRSYMRHSEVTKYPQYMKAALRCASMVASEVLRRELAVELRRLRKAEASALAAEIDPNPGTVPERFPNGSETVPEPFSNPPGTVNPSGTLPEPLGVGVGVREGSSFVVGYVGGEREAEPPTNEPPKTANDPPPRFCSKHPNGTADACLSCKTRRQAFDRWEIDQADQEREQARTDRATAGAAAAQAVRACSLCGDDGYRGGMPCDHVDRTETAKRGKALVDAELAKAAAARS